MRLKSLFFPIMVVISLIIFIAYIWPEINSIRDINENNIAKNAEMKTIADKKAAIELIGKKITSNVDGGDIVSNYLPANEVEERIISGINYLAGDANVSLVNIELSSSKNDAASGILAGNSSAAASDSIPATSGVANAQVSMKEVVSLQSLPIKISIIGDYAKIRIFLDGLQRMSIFNTIRSVTIVKNNNDSKKTATVDQAAMPADTTVVPADTTDVVLNADVNVDFGYLPVAKISSQQVEKFQNQLDDDTIVAMKKYISQKSQSLDGATAAGSLKGKVNPFVSN